MGRDRRQTRRARERRRQTQLEQRRRTQRSGGGRLPGRWSIVGGIGVIAAAVLLFVGFALNSSGAGSSAPATATVPSVSSAVDGIKCNSSEALAYHIHQHLSLYDHGKNVPLPSSIGMPGGEQLAACFYWLHVHAAYPGIIHVESPVQKTYILGQFFDIWKATKSYTVPAGDAYVVKLQQAAARGDITVFVGKKRWTKGYRSVPLTPHESITVEIGKPIVPPVVFKNWNGL